MKNILFISWDGPQTSYMEGLFIPIFDAIQNQSQFKIHILQFTWAGQDKLNTVRSVASAHGIKYTSTPVSHKPIASIGSVYTLLKGTKIIENYIKKNNIHIVMPRSNFPAFMVNRLKNKNIKIVFDADGLALEERVDFSGLSKKSFLYRFLSKVELKILYNADIVLTRSLRSIQVHLQKIGHNNKDKFFKVLNGRDISVFKNDDIVRLKKREELGIIEGQALFIYCGSLGPQYGWNEMISIFKTYKQHKPNSKFLILTGNIAFAKANLDPSLSKDVIIKSVPFAQVADYLSSGDVAFAIRKPTFSMQGVAPIKLGEYLLMNLPTIASNGIGDTSEIVQGVSNTHIFDHSDPNNIKNASTFAQNIKPLKTSSLRKVGIEHFSLEESASSYLKALRSVY